MQQITVFTDGGSILWKREEAGSSVPASILNDFIVQNNIESQFKPNVPNFTVKQARDASLQLNCTAINSTLLKYVNADAVAGDTLKIFKKICGDQLRENRSKQLPESTDLDIEKVQALVELHLKDLSPSDTSIEGMEPSVEINRPSASPSPAPSATAASISTKSTPKSLKKTKKKGKELRNWDGSNSYDGEVLDYSEATSETSTLAVADEELTLEGYGTASKDGFIISELSSELDNIMESEEASKESGTFSFFKGLVGGKKLSDSDLDKPLEAMAAHLVNKNVAKEVADHICEQVRKDLKGKNTDTWTGVSSTVKKSVTQTLRKILTPSTSVDLLLEIQRSKSKRPYTISVVGVNGVGKSTNLGKIAFWLLQNKKKVLIAACDTFRSGAVEQLKVHVQRLKQLTERQNAGQIEIYDQGYGKDAAVIAQKAVEYGERNKFDVVLIDTAGRRHNDDRLMSSLEKFGKLANPDKIIMVGEALVGTDSVQQARNFDNAFGPNRHLDFFLVSKCDTVGDMLGTLVNMTYSTGVPVLFVGVGQNYTDLRTLSVEWAVNLLLA